MPFIFTSRSLVFGPNGIQLNPDTAFPLMRQGLSHKSYLLVSLSKRLIKRQHRIWKIKIIAKSNA